ncbi:GGDEF domain-containing protein [Massilia sp. CF038]|uniref:GGDEF domain-containing protein n=1 Tax=Massilia sp. CF038 TaxID=1881045 RepID=UPI00091B3089|nr:GGDEF domain-containing protein [Massilia sp. CF038]SHH55521.1 PAS domain S-box-containing protein/diguanylate cyclase (GGDEF) domain-containing protein [Massilia sp. CF038]
MIDTLPISIVSRLIEESLDAVLVIDAGGCIRYMNCAMQGLSGYAPGEAIGQPLQGLMPEAYGEQEQGYIERFLANTRQADILGSVRAFAIRHRTGEMIPVEMKALDLGAVDGVHYYGAFMTDLRARRAAEAKNTALLEQLERQAMSDALTGLPNRRAFEIEAGRIVARAKRSGAPITVGIADIDRFKKVNDEHGHPVGDEVLNAVSAVLTQAARASDFVARIGGEEFGMLFPDARPETALAVAERMRRAVEGFPVITTTGVALNITISIGLAAFGGSLSESLSQADKALYEAKNKGRNRVEQK